MRLYIAAPWQLRRDAAALQHALEDANHVVTSTWIDKAQGHDDNTDRFANINLTDITSADVVVCLNPWSWATIGTGGRHVELGYALALKKRVLIIGCRTNIFHHLDAIVVVRTTEEALAWLATEGVPKVDPPKVDPPKVDPPKVDPPKVEEHK